MQKTREFGAEVGIPGVLKLNGKTITALGGGQISVQGFVREEADYDYPCPPVEHLHVWVQTTEIPILICHVDLVDAADVPGRYDHYRLDDVIAAQDDMNANGPFTEGLCFKVTVDRCMCAMIPTELISEDWRDRELLVRCTDAAGNTYYSDEPFHIDSSPED
jgi:hypothetical protein